MSDVYGDMEQLEALRHWWSENWKTVIAGLAIGIVAVLVWQGWTRYQSSHRMNAAKLYVEFQQAVAGGQNGGASAIAKKLTADYNSTPYASVAQLKLAQEDVSKAHFDAAAKRLQWVTEHGDDAGLRSVAQLRLAAVLWQQGKTNAALAKLAHPAPTFAGLYAALRGDIELSRGDAKAARSAYQAALAALPRDAAQRRTVEAKLASVAVAPSTPGKPAASSTVAP